MLFIFFNRLIKKTFGKTTKKRLIWHQQILFIMKLIYILIAICCAFSIYSQEKYLDKLPDNPEPGKCYAKCIVPDEFETETMQLLKVPAHTILQVVPAEYKVVRDEVVVKPASKKYKHIPATFKTVVDTFWIEEPYNKQYPRKAVFADDYEQVEVKSKTGKWVAGENPDCPSIDPNDCRIFHFREDPAVMRSVPVKRLVAPAYSKTKQVGGKYKLIKREVLVTPARTDEIEIPEVRDIVQRRVLVKDETTIAVDVPASYTTIEKRIITKKGGMTAWREVPCTLPNDAIVLPINYELGSARLTEDSKAIIDKHILSKLKSDLTAVVEVNSHTDSRGNAVSNQSLSERRSKSVVEYLNQRGIKTSRMIAVGYGESRLLNDCRDGITCSENEHAKNRRTEFKFY